MRTPIVIAPDTLYTNVSFRALSSTLKDKAISRVIRPCDEAIIRIITRWKSLLKADISSLTNRSISALFNAIIFVRGCEDSKLSFDSVRSRLLLDTISVDAVEPVNVLTILSSVLIKIGIKQPLSEYIDIDALSPFSYLDASTTVSLFKDMYTSPDGGYHLNFSLLSKHAMSRIYENYVAIFRQEDPYLIQSSFLPDVPKMETPSKTGVVYTPQFIAGFFANSFVIISPLVRFGNFAPSILPADLGYF